MRRIWGGKQVRGDAYSSLTPLLVVLVDGLSLSISLQSIYYVFFSFGLDCPLVLYGLHCAISGRSTPVVIQQF